MTFSILAHDPESGELGVATFSFALAVGAEVPVIRAGLGAAAVQADSPLSWRSVIVDRLEAGVSVDDIVGELAKSADARSSQVTLIDAAGCVSAHSGDGLEPIAGHATGSGAVAAANLMEIAEIPAAAVHAFAGSPGPRLASRLLDALIEADTLGGDVRGRQSAAISVVGPRASQPEALVNLRVDDARTPVAELRRLYTLWEARELVRASRDADGLYRDVEKAQAAVALAPNDQTSLGAAALALLRAGRRSEAAPYLKRLLELEPRTRKRLARLVDTGHLDENPLGDRH